MRTALVGMIHDAATFGVLTDDPHAKGGEDGEECEDEDGGHGDLCLSRTQKFITIEVNHMGRHFCNPNFGFPGNII